jgi:hypothetical protein
LGGVKVTAEGDIWAGDAEVRKYVTPVQLEFENHGVHPLRLRYSAMSLVSPDGQVFRAIPPFEMRGLVERTVDRLVPRFEYRDIELAPYLGPLYEGLEVEPLDAQIEDDESDELYKYWHVKVPLPTRYMREIALPESLVRPGGSVSGFVYFERVPESQQRVTLRVRLVNGETGQSFGTASLPFVVD